MKNSLPIKVDNWAIATMRDGAKISYQIIKGSGKGRCVLIHSLAMGGVYWSRVVPHLSNAADILIYDCRGHGRSEKLTGPCKVELHAQDLADLLSFIGWPMAVVAGSSMGGCIALAFAAAHPEQIVGLGLIDTTAWYGEKAPQEWEERGQKGFQNGMESLIEFQKSRWVSEVFCEAHPDVVDDAIAVFLSTDPRSYLETCRMLGAVDMRKALPNFCFPTAIVVGAEDYATPVAMAEAMQKAIPGAKLRIIQGVRHLTPLECPGKIADEIQGLINSPA